MSKFTENLWRDLVQEHGAVIAQAVRPGPGRSRGRRPRVLAGSTLALAGAGVAVALGLTATGSTPAFAVTRNADGTVLVTINQRESIVAANQKLKAMINEEVVLHTVAGPAPVSGPVTCTPGVPNMQGPPVRVLLGADGTQVIAPGTTGDNTGVGTWHITACYVYPAADMGTGGTGSGNTGNTGAG
jgi:hypothetical protein